MKNCRPGPGKRDLNGGFPQPIARRVDELVAGVKADVAVLLYGDDLDVLARKGTEIMRVLATITGAVDVKADYQGNIPTITVRVQHEQLACYGVNAQQVTNTVSSAGLGLIALLDAAVLHGLVWDSAAKQLRRQGMGRREAAHQAALIRIRPVLMTALVVAAIYPWFASAHEAESSDA